MLIIKDKSNYSKSLIIKIRFDVNRKDICFDVSIHNLNKSFIDFRHFRYNANWPNAKIAEEIWSYISEIEKENEHRILEDKNTWHRIIFNIDYHSIYNH